MQRKQTKSPIHEGLGRRLQSASSRM